MHCKDVFIYLANCVNTKHSKIQTQKLKHCVVLYFTPSRTILQMPDIITHEAEHSEPEKDAGR